VGLRQVAGVAWCKNGFKVVVDALAELEGVGLAGGSK